ncbi:PLP-dependent transferase [Collybia nuda]|uniref:PLP-dependent transferase n=1 Tax=Collybia nuda TaxID=64659 RepID=A0A9P5YCM6_9AGAR|nr:PLP-dependent transferase [Collybia nuda]
MSLLFKHLRVHQIFGANTDVGKTILTSALVRASALKNNNVFYLKPVSTGPLDSADDKHVKRFGGRAAHRIRTECLFQYDEPISPHLAAQTKGAAPPPSDETLVNAIAGYISRSAKGASLEAPGHIYIETAGGVHSPTLSGTTQVEAYRPLFLPTILIGDSKLGGISTTIASYEALLLRGYIIDAVLLFNDSYYRNNEYLHAYFAERGIQVAAVPPPPPLSADTLANRLATEQYYDTLVPAAKRGADDGAVGISDIVDHLDVCHTRRLDELASMPRRTLDTVWWPFVQHGLMVDDSDVTVIDSAHSDFFSIHRAPATSSPVPRTGTSILSPEFDGSASWWTQTFGHASTALTLAAARASGRYGHVMFPQATHLPALHLAERLVKEGPGKGWAARAFISDNGSTGMEVAIKMALRAFTMRRRGEEQVIRKIKRGEKEVFGVLGLKGSYHGDTIGAMDACEESGVYTCEWHDAKGYWFDPPIVAMRNGEAVISVPAALAGQSTEKVVKVESVSWTYDVARRLDSELASVYRNYITDTLGSLSTNQDVPTLAALVLEPLVLGAGGMIFVDPLFQRILIDVVRSGGIIGLPSLGPDSWSGLPVVFDEVFVGLYRLGLESTGPLLGVLPDISVNAKILTGGLVPLAVTLASEAVFDAFLGTGKGGALLHGHSYTAHAVGCEVAGETMRIVDRLKESEGWNEAKGMWGAHPTTQEDASKVWSFWDPGFVESVSRMAEVEEVMTLGCVLAVKIKDNGGGYVSHSAQEVFGKLKDCVGSMDDMGSVAPGGAPYGIHFRTLGNVAYFMTSLNTKGDVIRSVEDRIWRTLMNRQAK